MAGLVAVTRPGNRKQCTLYAVTLWPLDYDPEKMVHGPGSYATDDWSAAAADSGDELSTFTVKDNPAPAVWNSFRKGEPRKKLKNATSHPAAGQPPSDMTPLRDNPPTSASGIDPAAGSKGPDTASEVTPLRDTFLEAPSDDVGFGPGRQSSLQGEPCEGAHYELGNPA